MLLVSLAVVLAAQPVTVASPRFSSAGLDPTLVSAWQDRFLSRLAAPGLQITSASDIEQVLGLERQRQLLGCETGSSSCLAELAGALGVELLLTGNLVKSESGYVATLRVVRTADGRAIASPTARLDTERALLDWLDEQADALQGALRGTHEAPPSPAVRWAPALVGAGLLVGSGVFFGLSAARYDALVGPTPPALEQVHRVRVEGETFSGVAIGLGAAGGAAVLTSVLWAALAPPDIAGRVQPVASLAPHGATFGLQGTFP